MIELREITKDNLDEVLNLNVSEQQKAFVSSTASSLAQAYVYRDTTFPFAVYRDNTVIGFIMFGYYESRKQYTLWKFLIDVKYQNKGFGREALMQGITYVKSKYNVKELYTGVCFDNERAKHLYKSIGFMETSVIADNMEELKLIM